MKKLGLAVMAVAIALAFASVAVAADSTPSNPCNRPCATPCSKCAKPAASPCSTCAKPCAAPCAKPCATPCSTPCMSIPKVKVNWAWPTVCVEPCAAAAPCAAPCAPKCMSYTRDVLGKKIPLQTIAAGNAGNDSATGYEASMISGQ